LLPNSQGFPERWYAFRLGAHTRLSLTIDDVENPVCSATVQPVDTLPCGSVRVTLLNSSGTELRQSRFSSPREGVSAPVTISVSLRAGGTYYAEVAGYTNGKAMPFTLRVRGRPSVRR
jgi:hypothetical protein